MQCHAASFEEGTTSPLKAFQRMLGLMAAALPVLWLGLHATYPVLAEAECSILSLASRTPPHNGDSGLCISPGPLERPLLAKVRRDLRHSAQKEGCHDRCFQQGLGSAERGQTDLWSLVREGVVPAHQLPGNSSSVPSLSILPTGNMGTPHASMLSQQVRGIMNEWMMQLYSALLCNDAQDLGLTSHPKDGAFWQYSVPVTILGH